MPENYDPNDKRFGGDLSKQRLFGFDLGRNIGDWGNHLAGNGGWNGKPKSNNQMFDYTSTDYGGGQSGVQFNDPAFRQGGEWGAREGEYFPDYMKRMSVTADDMIASGDAKLIERGQMLKRTIGQMAQNPSKFGGQFAGGGKSKEDDVSNNIKTFYERMTRPLDENDPEVKNAMNMGRNVASNEAANRGIEGGYSNAEGQRAATSALSPLQAQRNNLAMGALGLQSNRDLALYDRKASETRYDADLSRQKIQSGYDQAAASGRQPWETVGRHAGGFMGFMSSRGGGGGGMGQGGGGGGGGGMGGIGQGADIGGSSWGRTYDTFNNLGGGGYNNKKYGGGYY